MNTIKIFFFFVCLHSYSDGQKSFWKKRRNQIAFLASLGYFNLYMLRVNLTLGIVAMTSSTDTRVSLQYENGIFSCTIQIIQVREKYKSVRCRLGNMLYVTVSTSDSPLLRDFQYYICSFADR